MEKINKHQFNFRPVGYGRYKVTYTTPITHTAHSAIITDMSLIDSTKNQDEPTQSSLQELRRAIKFQSSKKGLKL